MQHDDDRRERKRMRCTGRLNGRTMEKTYTNQFELITNPWKQWTGIEWRHLGTLSRHCNNELPCRLNIVLLFTIDDRAHMCFWHWVRNEIFGIEIKVRQPCLNLRCPICPMHTPIISHTITKRTARKNEFNDFIYENMHVNKYCSKFCCCAASTWSAVHASGRWVRARARNHKEKLLIKENSSSDWFFTIRFRFKPFFWAR